MKKISLKTWIVLAGAVLYFAFFSTLSILAHQGFQTQMNDLGNMDQAVWRVSQGDLTMRVSNFPHGQIGSRVLIHSNFIFWLLGPLYRIWSDPRLLLILTSLACALAGLGLYFFAKHHLGKSGWCLVPPFAFWLSPLVHDANLFDFHVLTLAAAFLVWAVWAFETGRFRTAWVCVFLAMTCQEDISLATFFLGIYFVLTGKRRQGASVMAASALYAVLVLGAGAGHLKKGQQMLAEISGRYYYLGRGPFEIIKSAFLHPEKVFAVIFRADHLRLPLYLLVSGAAAGLAAWPMLLLILPSFAIAMLSETPWTTRITGTYYWVICAAIIVMACVLAAAKRIKNKPGVFPAELAYLGTASVIFSLLFSPAPHGMGAWRENYQLPAERKTLEEAVRLIPEKAEVCAQNNLGPHLSQRPLIRTYPSRCQIEKTEYVLVQLRYHGGPDSGFFVRTHDLFMFQMPVEAYISRVERLILSAEWGLLFQKDGFYLFARQNSPAPKSEAALAKFREDADVMKSAYSSAKKHYIKWAGYLTGRYSSIHF